jgi:hypothetical protein
MCNSKVTVLILAFTTAIISCNKNNDTIPAVPTVPTIPAEKKLVINLQNATVKSAEIDSASVVFRKQGSFNPVYQRLDKKTNTLETTFDGLPVGEWTAELDLYTKKQADDKSYEHVATKPFTITSSTGVVTINGPSLQGADGWKERLVLSTSDSDIVVIIPVDVTDPYFEIRTKGFQWNSFSVKRIAVSGTAVVTNKKWICNNDCPGDDRLIYNSDAFVPFTEIIKNTPWTRNEIVISVGNIQNQYYNDFVHEWNY